MADTTSAPVAAHHNAATTESTDQAIPTTTNTAEQPQRNIVAASLNSNISNDEVEETPAQTHPTMIASLRMNEKCWIWKFGLRAFVCVINIIAIGSTGWVLSTGPSLSDSLWYGYFNYFDTQVGAIIILPISTVWCMLAIGIPFLRKPARPIHPGIAVGVDLVFWIGFIIVGLFCVTGLLSLLEFGTGGSIDDLNYNYGNVNYNGDYYLAPNNTWIFNVTYIYGTSQTYDPTTNTYSYPPFNQSDVQRDCQPSFKTCADQDAFVNRLWHEKGTRVGLQYLVVIILWLDVILHFTLFVWACVDTHRINARKGTKRERIVADRIIADLQSRGLISVQNGIVVGPGTGMPMVAPALQQQYYHQQQQAWRHQQQQQQPPEMREKSAQSSSSSQPVQPHPAMGYFGSDVEQENRNAAFGQAR